ncbi:DUF4258 domain-containing protein [Candidatus Woesearchaeota archaeon]|nr:DUF4258 domain-containing protein [Candidatus Woesearchaeota archaeon]
MLLEFSNHAIIRMKQRGISDIHILYVLQHPIHIKKYDDDVMEAEAIVDSRSIKIIFTQNENFIKIITVI